MPVLFVSRRGHLGPHSLEEVIDKPIDPLLMNATGGAPRELRATLHALHSQMKYIKAFIRLLIGTLLKLFIEYPIIG